MGTFWHLKTGPLRPDGREVNQSLDGFNVHAGSEQPSMVRSLEWQPPVLADTAWQLCVYPVPISVQLWSEQWSFQWNQRHDGNQLSATGGGLCKAHQVILCGGKKPVLGRKTRQDVQALWEQGGYGGRKTCVWYLFMVNWTVAVETTSHPWSEGKQQFVGRW